MSRVQAFVFAVAVASAILAAPLASAQSTGADGLIARVDALAEAFVLQDSVPGAVLSVVVADRTFVRSYGQRRDSEDPNGRRFEIGSISKVFTWVAIMMLVEEGRVDLRQDVRAYVPDIALPGDAPLTLAHLMSHRGGFAESYDIFKPEIATLPRTEALRATIPEQVFARGEVVSYSNWGAAMAGYVVEAVSGETWEAFVQSRVLDPLGMADTTTAERLRGPDQPPLAESWRIVGGVPVPAYRIDIGAFGPAGGMASTPVDMARFMRFLLGDGSVGSVRLLAPETMARMRTRLFDDRPQASDMAHGFQTKPRWGVVTYGHGGGLNEFLSNVVVAPELRTGVFVSQSGGTGASLPLLLPDLVLSALAEEAGFSPEPPQPVADAVERAGEAEGRWIPNRRSVSGPTQILAALGPLAVTATGDGSLLIPSPKLGAISRFEPIAADVWEDALGDRVMLIRDDAGQAVRLADPTGAHSYDRARGLSDPLWLVVAIAAAFLLSVTTAIGLLWRHGLRGGGRAGTVAAGAAVLGAASVAVLVATGIVAAIAAVRLGGQYLFDQPQPTMTAVLLASDAVVVAAVLLLLSNAAALRATGWGLLRKLHHAAFALVLPLLAVLLVRWGLAFGGPV